MSAEGTVKRFGEALKIPGGGEAERCFYSLRFDSYGCGCSHNCGYCYARAALDFRQLWDKDNPHVASASEFRKTLTNALKGGPTQKHFRLLFRKTPLRLGGMTDCFGEAERHHRVTKRVLSTLLLNRYPSLILTKSTMVAEPEYMRLLDPNLTIVQFTITTPFDDMSLLFEPGAPPTSERLEAARKLADAGIHTAIRINPLFPEHVDGYYSYARRHTLKRFRYFDYSLVDMAAEAGFKTVIAGFVRLGAFNLKWLREQGHRDVRWLFQKGMSNTALHFSRAEKAYYYDLIKKRTEARGMEFSVCYDGDEDYEAFRPLWANQDDCCNALGKIEGFRTTAR